MFSVDQVCRDRDADAVCHVGTRADATVRYLTDYDGPGRVGVVGRADGDAGAWHCFVPDPSRVDANRVPYLAASDADATMTVEPASTPLGETVAATLADHGVERVLTPRSVPHDVALYVESRGVDLASTDAVGHARATKTEPERKRVRTATRAAVAGVEAGASTLARASARDGRLHAEDGPVTVEGLRRCVASAVAAAGGRPGPDVRVDQPDADDADADDILVPGVPVVVDCVPQVDGYHARVTRSLVADGSGGVERRAQVALRAAREAALGALRDGESVASANREARAEVGAYGFDADGPAVCGVGLDPRERPLPTSDVAPDPGTTLVVAPAVAGDVTVRTGDTVIVTDDGVASLVAVTDALDPGQY